MEDNNNDDISGDEDAGVDHLVDVDLELLLQLVEVFLWSLASPHPAGWGVGKPARWKNSEDRFSSLDDSSNNQIFANIQKEKCVEQH